MSQKISSVRPRVILQMIFSFLIRLFDHLRSYIHGHSDDDLDLKTSWSSTCDAECPSESFVLRSRLRFRFWCKNSNAIDLIDSTNKDYNEANVTPYVISFGKRVFSNLKLSSIIEVVL